MDYPNGKGACGMVSLEELERLEHAGDTRMDADALEDLQRIILAGNTPAERLNRLLEQAKNPYCYRVGKTTVRISFLNVEESLEEKLQRFFINLKNK